MKKLKIISKDKDVKKVFSESEVMAILERMEDGIKVVAEGVIGVQRQLDGLTDEVHSFRDDMYSFRAETNARFEQIDARFERVEANQKITLDHLFCTDERFEAMEKELKEIKSELVRIGGRKFTSEETSSLSRRVEALERDMKKYQVFMKSNEASKAA
jgi:phage shock protein A